MNLTIRTKLLVGFTIILLLLVSASLLMTNKLSDSNARLENLVDVTAQRLILSKNVLIQVLSAAKQEKNIVLEKDISEKNQYRNKLNEALTAIDKNISELEQLVTEKGTKDLSEFKVILNEYKLILNEIIQMDAKNENEAAIEISQTKGFKAREGLSVNMATIIERNEKWMEADKIINGENYKSSFNLIIAFIIASLTISIVISYWIIRGITKRISFIAGEAERIASREHT
ncbi:MAG TPA: MCP four helix bundle domain-containing protein, partial [Chitinophagaceae bacterium]|nr:MCP four helix bundle domain-containing protein [Chitinophagaceae bacterium]